MTGNQPHDTNETMGARIRMHRMSKGLSMRKLGEAAGVKYQAVQQWENDAVIPATLNMPPIEDALELEPGTLGAWVRFSPLLSPSLRSATQALPGYVSRAIMCLLGLRTNRTGVLAAWPSPHLA